MYENVLRTMNRKQGLNLILRIVYWVAICNTVKIVDLRLFFNHKMISSNGKTFLRKDLGIYGAKTKCVVVDV